MGHSMSSRTPPYPTPSDFDENWYIYSVPWNKHVRKILRPNDLRGQIQRSSNVTIFQAYHNVQLPVVIVLMHLECQNDC